VRGCSILVVPEGQRATDGERVCGVHALKAPVTAGELRLAFKDEARKHGGEDTY
jgi:hypothetical protein